MVDKDGKDLQVGDKVLVEMEVAGENKLPLDVRLEWHGKDKPSLAFNAAACHISKIGEWAPAVEESGADDSILTGTATEVIELVPALTTAEEIETLITAEEAGKKRSTVLKALRDKLATLPK